MSWPAPDARPAVEPRTPYGVTAAPRNRVADLAAGYFTLAGSVLLGAPMGLLWSELAPHARVVISAGGATIADGATEVFVAADGWFLAVCVAIGVLTGFLAWLVARRSGPFVVVALAIGGLLGAWIASEVGMRPGQDELRAAAAAGIQGEYVANVALQATQVLLAWPVAALGTFLALVASRADEID